MGFPSSVRPLGHQTDTQPPGVAPDLLGKRTVRRRRVIWVAGHRPADRIEDAGGVAHRDRQRAFGRQAVPRFTDHGAERDAPAARLQADDAALRGGDADRAAAVAGVCCGNEAGRDGRGTAAAGAARGVLDFPGIARRAVGQWLGGGGETQLGRVCLAEHDEPCLAEFADEIAVIRGDEPRLLHELHAAVHRIACAGRNQVLQ